MTFKFYDTKGNLTIVSTNEVQRQSNQDNDIIYTTILDRPAVIDFFTQDHIPEQYRNLIEKIYCGEKLTILEKKMLTALNQDDNLNKKEET